MRDKDCWVKVRRTALCSQFWSYDTVGWKRSAIFRLTSHSKALMLGSVAGYLMLSILNTVIWNVWWTNPRLGALHHFLFTSSFFDLMLEELGHLSTHCCEGFLCCCDLWPSFVLSSHFHDTPVNPVTRVNTCDKAIVRVLKTATTRPLPFVCVKRYCLSSHWSHRSQN